MLEHARRFVGCLVSRFRFRHSRDKVISFTHSLADAQSALVIMPLGKVQEHPPASLLGMLRKRFREENITLIMGQDGPAPTATLPRSQIIRVSGRDVSFFFLPRSEIIQRVKRREYDVAIDLNLDFMLPSAYICKESSARVRVGFSRKNADTFFNFQVRLDPESRSGSAHDRLLNCLQMFFADEGV
jgi:hypothetical protein